MGACDSLLDDLSSSSSSSGDSDASSVSSVEDTLAKGGAPDVNSNADSSFCDLNDKAIDKSNDIVNSLLNADVRSSSKASAVVSGASVCSNLSTVDAAGGFGSSILVDGSSDKDSTAATNVELDADGPAAARAGGENVQNVLSATQNSGVNVNTEVNTSGGSAPAEGGDVVVGNKEGSAIGGASGLAGNVNPGSLAAASAMLGGSPEHGTVTTEVLSSGYVNPTSEAGDFLMDVDASLNAGLFGPDSEVDCSLPLQSVQNLRASF